MDNDKEEIPEIGTGTGHRPDQVKFEEFINRIKDEKKFPQNMSEYSHLTLILFFAVLWIKSETVERAFSTFTKSLQVTVKKL